MLKSYAILMRLAAALLLFLPCALWAEDWQLLRDDNGIQIYNKSVVGSEIKAVRGTTVIKANLGRLVTLLAEPSLRPLWDKYCGESYWHDGDDSGESLLYVHSKLPWPVTDRDMLLEVMWEQNPNDLTVTMHSVVSKRKLANIKGRVRVVEGWNNWELIPLSEGKVQISSSAHIDPAGPVPPWLLNMLAVESPYDILRRLKKLAADESILSKRYDFMVTSVN